MATDTPTTTLARRALLAAGALTAAPAAIAAPPAPPQGSGPSSDAELIRLCDGYVAALDAFNNDPLELDADDSPFWAQAKAFRAQLEEAPDATTLAGVLAEARVAQFMATQPDGLHWEEAFTGQWCGWVVESLLRVSGRIPA